MRIEAALLVLLLGTAGCLGKRAPAGPPDGGVADGGTLRPLAQPITVQAAFNDAVFFLDVRWSSDSVAPALSVAISTRQPATAVRDFAVSGCFLGCHDASNDMPNWRPEDGERPMHLLPGFGGPAEVWLWKAQPGDPSGQAAVTSMGTDGMNDDPDAGAGGLTTTAALAERAWNVVYVRALVAMPPGKVGLTAGARYDLGFALHPDDVEGRHHYVSLPVSLGLGDPAAELVAVPLPAGATPDFSDTASFPLLALDLFLPGITSFEFLVGAVVNRDGHVRSADYRHGGAQAVAAGSHTCSDCHRVVSDSLVPPVQNAGALERLVLRRGGVVGPPQVEVPP